MDSSISHSLSHTQRNQNPSSSLSNRVQPPTITTRSEPGDLYPTTFVQTDPSMFKQVVQMLTAKPPIKSIVPKKHHHHHHQHTSAFKLYERRNSRNRSLNVNNLSLHSLTLGSPVTPLITDPFENARPYLDMEAEEQAIKEKRFFLHPSPISTRRNSKPRLLPLFPISPRDSSR